VYQDRHPGSVFGPVMAAGNPYHPLKGSESMEEASCSWALQLIGHTIALCYCGFVVQLNASPNQLKVNFLLKKHAMKEKGRHLHVRVCKLLTRVVIRDYL
jgi:hypothetical protein